MDDDDDAPELERLLTKKQVLAIVPFSYPTIWSWMRQNRFPRSLVVGTGPAARTVWLESEVRAWMANLPRSRLLGDEPEKPKRRRLRQK